MDNPEELHAQYIRDWRRWQEGLIECKPLREGGRDLYRISTAVLQTHHARSIPGGLIASLSTPWGQTRGDTDQASGTSGYHLIWPRDLVHSASGLFAAGAKVEALDVLCFLRATQMADGHWPQNMWVDGQPFWTGIQLGETAFPILLLDLLRRDGVLSPRELPRFWPMVRRAASYIVRCGPSTQQDRWENQRGYTPYTLAAVIASFLVAAELADQMSELTIGNYLRETADAWNSAIESWLYVTGTELAHRLAIDGYYVRSIMPECDEVSSPRTGHLVLKTTAAQQNGILATEIISPDALALVRFGLRAPDDPRIVSTLKAIDALLRVETPGGPCWHRYNGDRYGEQVDGSPFDRRPGGVGRAWPLLTGERGHYELMAGHQDEAIRLLKAMASFAGDGGMIPEQVWDTENIPERGLFLGRPSGSAMPLCWAHAEYIKLRRSLADGQSFDTPPQTVVRYLREKVGSRLAIWRFDHRRQAISPGDILRVEVLVSRRSLDPRRLASHARGQVARHGTERSRH